MDYAENEEEKFEKLVKPGRYEEMSDDSLNGGEPQEEHDGDDSGIFSSRKNIANLVMDKL